MIKVILLSVILVTLGVAGIAIKLLVKKNGKFSGTCAGNSPYLKEKGVACSICGALPDEECKKE